MGMGPDAAPKPPEDSKLIAHIDEDKAPQELKAYYAKILQIAKLSPKTHKSLLKNHLWKPAGECPAASLVEIQPAPGLLVAKGAPKVRDKMYERLKAAGAVAKQRGTAVEVLEGQLTVKDALDEWNKELIDTTLQLIKAAPPADQGEKNFAPTAKAAVGQDRDPKEWDAKVCDVGRLGGWAVTVQLVSVDAAGHRLKVVVKGGADAERFTKETLASVYWEKEKGKEFRTLTEIMAVGGFVRQCSAPDRFRTSPTTDGTWRCNEGTESWDEPNRPIPQWR